MISFHYNCKDYPVFDTGFFTSTLPKLLVLEDKQEGDIAIIFTNDEELLSINQAHLKHDFYTDIITFDYSVEQHVCGDLFISLERVADNAIAYDSLFFTELCRVIYHGVLHLCGYNDKDDADIQLMRTKEDFYIDHFVSRETN
jgi:rRNA maturation RNase YbeY